jgi:hypothetical protein
VGYEGGSGESGECKVNGDDDSWISAAVGEVKTDDMEGTRLNVGLPKTDADTVRVREGEVVVDVVDAVDPKIGKSRRSSGFCCCGDD